MLNSSSLCAQLSRIERVLRTHKLWQTTAPSQEAWQSDRPFFMNTMEPCEWLQWVLIPRLNQLIDSGSPLPEALAVSPYYEHALEESFPGRELLLLELQRLDALFAPAANHPNA